ncbi:hypothetical protein SSX86_004692 [Deinandra increscens subsp. villosa]|uniref:Uncharacterized protein n=1 Tax=Deinandra increscens subsp. villosa TaxID=3103831 RepID=A0AAP0DSJ0_9ASTR
MAAAEARTAWQRTANRYFVQEDAKRAPKLACVPPSSSSLSKQNDPRPPANGITDFAPPTTDPSYSNLSPDSRWWLQLQPNYIHQNDLTIEKVNMLEAENSHQFVDIKDLQSTVKGELLGEESYEFVEMESVYKEVDEFSLESDFPHWMENEKNHELPWWRMTDKDDLASFVVQRSHDFMENCDLPSPQNASFKRNVYAHDRSPRKEDEIAISTGISIPQKHQGQNAASPNASSGSVSHLSSQSSDNTVHEGSRTPEKDPSKRKLLEALCHSQTRAREAERAAKQAYEEKEHIVKLIFKQASQLFAYKQWVYLLQLENLYNQIKANKMNPVLPASPWHIPRRKTRRNSPVKKKKRESKGIGVSSCKHDVGKYAVAFVVGLGLVGAGLLLGWTVGWMFM